MDKDRTKGYVYAGIAAASYGLNPLFALPMYGQGMGVDSVLFYRYFFAALVLAGLMVWRGESFALRRVEVLPLVGMGLLVSFSSLFLFESYNLMDAGIASTILFIYPVMVAVMMALFFHERISKLTMFSIVLALSGIALLYKSSDGATLSLWGVGLVFLSSLSYAIYIVMVNRSSVSSMSAEKLTFYLLAFGLVIYVVRTDFGFSLQPLVGSWMWSNAIGLALLPTVVSLVAMAAAIRRIGSTPTAILGALEPVTALCVGVAIFGEVLTVRIGMGVMLILAAVLLIIGGRPLLQRLPFWPLRR